MGNGKILRHKRKQHKRTSNSTPSVFPKIWLILQPNLHSLFRSTPFVLSNTHLTYMFAAPHYRNSSWETGRSWKMESLLKPARGPTYIRVVILLKSHSKTLFLFLFPFMEKNIRTQRTEIFQDQKTSGWQVCDLNQFLSTLILVAHRTFGKKKTFLSFS